MTPTQLPLIISLIIEPLYCGSLSCNKRMPLLLNQLIIGLLEQFVVTTAEIAICLCKPILPPSGVSTGSMIPH